MAASGESQTWLFSLQDWKVSMHAQAVDYAQREPNFLGTKMLLGGGHSKALWSCQLMRAPPGHFGWYTVG